MLAFIVIKARHSMAILSQLARSHAVCSVDHSVIRCICMHLQEATIDEGNMSKTPPNRRGINFEVGAQPEARDSLKNW